MQSDLMVENPMIRPLELVKPAKRIDHKKISAYNKAIDLLDDAALELTFPHADIYRAEIHRMQRRIQDEVFRLEDGINE